MDQNKKDKRKKKSGFLFSSWLFRFEWPFG